ncbi:hypothetical protein QJS04_geneDACA024673 [Acorus gramineus]|uniref:Uncharacterized protein n=1 Tax=Acorus gramineus TaxID=55184 RepID=A0AAV9AQC3_ACOGR|nr:hypothetical protein QJS04_geneDACA024673 [Acorus gramineus]
MTPYKHPCHFINLFSLFFISSSPISGPRSSRRPSSSLSTPLDRRRFPMAVSSVTTRKPSIIYSYINISYSRVLNPSNLFLPIALKRERKLSTVFDPELSNVFNSILVSLYLRSSSIRRPSCGEGF